MIYDGVPKSWTDRQMSVYIFMYLVVIALSGRIQNLQFNKMARESEKNEISPLKTKKLLLADQILNIWIFILV